MDFVNFDNIGNYQLRVIDKIDNAGLHNFLTASLIENHEKRFLFNKCVSQNNVQKISGSIIFFGFSQVYWGFLPKVSLMAKRAGVLRLYPEISFVGFEGLFVVYCLLWFRSQCQYYQILCHF